MKQEVNGLNLIKRNLTSMSDTEKRIANYIIENPSEVIYITTKALAARTEVSEGTVIKFSTRLGFSGFSELKINIAQQLGPEDNYIFDTVTIDDSPKHALQKMIKNMQSTLETTFQTISEKELLEVCAVLSSAKKIDLYGVGSSAMVANDIYYRLMRIGLPAYAITDPHISEISASMLNSHCLAIGISHSGRTIETLSTMQRAKNRKAKTLCVTGYANSPLAKLCDYTIVISSRESQIHKEAVTARLGQLLVFDSLCAYISCQQKDKSVALMDNVIDIIDEHRKQE